MKEPIYYFPHNYNARNDPKLQDLMMDLGAEGVGIYWCLVEMLYEQCGYLPFSSLKNIAYTLHTDKDKVGRVICDFDLFEREQDDNGDIRFFSPAVLRKLDEIKSLIEKKSRAGKASAQSRMARKESSLNEARRVSENEQVSNTCSTDDEQETNTCSTNKIKLNKTKLNEIKLKENSSSFTSEEEKESFLEIFFFERNWRSAQYELKRFVSYYEGKGWKFNDGLTVGDRLAVCSQWKPEDNSQRFTRPEQKEALKWLHSIYKDAKANGEPGTLFLMTEVVAMESKTDGDKLHLFYKCSERAYKLICKYTTVQGVIIHGIKLDQK